MNAIQVRIQSDKKMVAEFLKNLNTILNDKNFSIDKNFIIIKTKKEKYIKIKGTENKYILCLSFHYAEKEMTFPYA